MLDRAKIAQEIAQLSAHLFRQQRFTHWLTPELFSTIVRDPHFLRSIYNARSEHYLALWKGELDQLTTITPCVSNYTVLAIDGSQIYPDHHVSGIDCFLVNVAGCLLAYGPQSQVSFFSYPHLYVPQNIEEQLPNVQFSTDLVDLLREDHEFTLLIEKAEEMPTIALFDGNLLFWHLENKGQALKEIFLKRYVAHLDVLYQKKIVHAGYLSQSQFRDIVQLFQVGLATHSAYREQHIMLASMTDADLLTNVLEPGQRTTVLYSSTSIVELYPPYLVPCFFYLNVGSEIVRVEVPLWIGNDDELVDKISAVCLDQAAKGNGYPVALAEAHAHAVVKTADRDFFYHHIQKYAIDARQRLMLSPKSLKKRSMNI